VRKHLVLLGILFVAWRPSGAQQPSSTTQEVLIENELVRVIEIHMLPGVAEAKHSHAHGVTIALTDYDNELTTYPDRTVVRRHTKFGEVRWAEPVTHEARNTGATEQRVIRVDIKRDAPPAPVISQSDPLDSLVVCKDTQTLIFENQFVRVIQEKVPPGVAQPTHRHRHGVLVPLADAEIESVDEGGGQPVRRQLKFGDASWREPVVHAVRNVGKTELLNIRIEVK
jgi:beta-alanine degradation protein BauB